MAPSESFVMTVTKKFREKKISKKCSLNKRQHTELRHCGLKWDEGAEKFIKRAKVFNWSDFVSAYRSGVSLHPGIAMEAYALQLSHNWPESSRMTLLYSTLWLSLCQREVTLGA